MNCPQPPALPDLEIRPGYRFLVPLALALLAASWLAALDQAPWLWGLASFAGARLPILALASLLLLLALIPPVSRLVGRVFLATPLPMRGSGPFWIGLATVPVFFFLRSMILYGDWKLVLERLCLDLYYPSNLWTNYLFRIVAILGRPLELLDDDVIALTSALSGGVFVAFCLRLCGRLGGDVRRARLLFWFTFLTGSTLIFFGHLEVYAPLAACLVVVLDLAILAREGRISVGLTGLMLGITFCFHGSAGLFLLPLLAAIALWHPGRRLRQTILTFLAFLAPVLLAGAVLFLLHWRAEPPSDPAERYGTFIGAAGQGLLTPLSRTREAPESLYVLSEWTHWRDRFNVLLRLAPVALILAIPPLFRRGRKRFPGDPIRADIHEMLRLFIATYLAWMAVHNLSYPVPLDWDLFAPAGFLLALFAVLSSRRPHPGNAGVLLALCMFTALPWWLTNILPIENRVADSHFKLARTYQAVGSPESEIAFVQHLKHAASIGHRPHKEAVRTLSVYLASRRIPEAEVWLQRAADGYPQDPDMQANLGLWYLWRKKYEGALERMRIAVTLDPGHAVYHRDLGRLLDEIQKCEDAYRHFRKAADLIPAVQDITDEAIEAAWKVNRRKEGLKLLERLLDYHPLDKKILERLIEMNKQIGTLEDAKKYQNRLIEVLKWEKEREKEKEK